MKLQNYCRYGGGCMEAVQSRIKAGGACSAALPGCLECLLLMWHRLIHRSNMNIHNVLWMYSIMFLFQPTYVKGCCAPLVHIYETDNTNERPFEGCREFAAIDSRRRTQSDISYISQRRRTKCYKTSRPLPGCFLVLSPCLCGFLCCPGCKLHVHQKLGCSSRL